MPADSFEPNRGRDEDRFVVRQGVSWAEYQQALEERGEHSAPRIAYLEGTCANARGEEVARAHGTWYVGKLQPS